MKAKINHYLNQPQIRVLSRGRKREGPGNEVDIPTDLRFSSNRYVQVPKSNANFAMVSVNKEKKLILTTQ